jgi:hypothetical protein
MVVESPVGMILQRARYYESLQYELGTLTAGYLIDAAVLLHHVRHTWYVQPVCKLSDLAPSIERPNKVARRRRHPCHALQPSQQLVPGPCLCASI